MRFLLDTHALAWAIGEPYRLSPRVRKILEDPANELFVSSASVWEMSIKFKAGRWAEVVNFMDERLFAGSTEAEVETAVSNVLRTPQGVSFGRGPGFEDLLSRLFPAKFPKGLPPRRQARAEQMKPAQRGP